MKRGALLLYDIFIEKFEDIKLDSDYVTGIKSDDIQKPFRNLFTGILIQGIKDATGKKKQHRDSAQEWLDSNNIHIASFIYVCVVLDLDVKKAREKIKTYIGDKNAGLSETIKMPCLH